MSTLRTPPRTTTLILAALAFALALGTACDGTLDVEGVVVDDKTGAPVEGARFWMSDIVYDEKLRAYLKQKGQQKGSLQAPDGETAIDGIFKYHGLLAGPGYHEVWMVVRHKGYQEKRVLVYKEKGFTRTLSLVVRLDPLPK